jgi:hypothetical protein
MGDGGLSQCRTPTYDPAGGTERVIFRELRVSYRLKVEMAGAGTLDKDGHVMRHPRA